MADHPDDFIVVPISPLTEEQAEAFRAGAQAGLQRGAEHERGAIVAWLRCRIAAFDNPVLLNAADLIERGAHLRGDDE